VDSDKVQYIQDFNEIDINFDKKSLFSALVNCLTPAEACKVLDLTFEQELSKRWIIQSKIAKDMEAGVQECHVDLAHKLVTVFGQLPPKRKRACAYCIRVLIEHLSDDIRFPIVEFLLESSVEYVRQNAYHTLKKNWGIQYQFLILNAWEKYSDLSCAKLIIDHFPAENLVEHFDALQDTVKDTGYLARLYLKIGEHDFTKLKTLPVVDEIRLTYAATKLRHSFEESYAVALFERNKYSDSIGLLIWCFGQMKLWSVLEKIRQVIDTLPYERFGIKFKPEVTQNDSTKP